MRRTNDIGWEASQDLSQLKFRSGDTKVEDPAYLTKQLITYIGNKRTLLNHIGTAISIVKKRLAKDRLRILDAFSGSGVVSRYFKQHAEYLAVNDFENYATVASQCYLANRNDVDLVHLGAIVAQLNNEVDFTDFPSGFIEELYAPKNEARITKDDRVFYTRANACRLDNYRRLLDQLRVHDRNILLGPLLSEASVHANTSGVFKGFYKDRATKIGRFGGTNGDALKRIKGEIELAVPVLSRFECDVEVFQEDANQLIHHLHDLDLVYLDPPYNQHPYGSNYFMLNLLVDYDRPLQISKVSGIPTDWRRSDYNVRSRSLSALTDLVHNIDAKLILISFNDEGFIHPNAMAAMLRNVGKLNVIELPYNTFRGSRNLRQRTIHVTEHLFLVERN